MTENAKNSQESAKMMPDDTNAPVAGFSLGDTFGLKDYELYRDWAVENGYTVKEIDSSDSACRQFQITLLPQPAELTYAQKRAQSYPSIPDQLDMIYWDKINGTNTWMENITRIKQLYPKE